MTRERLEEIKAKLAEEAPDAVKHRMAEKGPEPDAAPAVVPEPVAAFRPAGKLDMPAF